MTTTKKKEILYEAQKHLYNNNNKIRKILLLVQYTEYSY